MKKLFNLLFAACLGLACLPVAASERLGGVLRLATDDVVALSQIIGTPERHVMLYFGNYQH